LNQLKSQTIFLDTAPLIYFIEGTTAYQANLKKFFAAFDSGDFPIISSTLTLLEVLVQPIKLNRQDLVEQYRQILSSASGIEIIRIWYRDNRNEFGCGIQGR
jgi:predicted nucleic acid-binding protein